MTARKRSLRARLWSEADMRPDVIGEAFRDVHAAIERMRQVDVVKLRNVIWAPGASFAVGERPATVALTDARLTGSKTPVDAGAVEWTIRGDRVDVAAASGLTAGTAYDLTFTVVY